MDALLSRHLPVITDRLQFSSQKFDPPPVITPRINFAKQLATLKRVTREETQSTTRMTDNSMNVDDSSDSEHNTTFIADFNSDSGGEEGVPDKLDTIATKIPKPRGQVGHPGSGGYSLDFVLRKWGSTLISDVNVNSENKDNNHRSSHLQKLVKREADRLLDTGTSYRSQNLAEIDNICVLVSSLLFQMSNSHCCIYQGYKTISHCQQVQKLLAST
jgi:hypothetical protein